MIASKVSINTATAASTTMLPFLYQTKTLSYLFTTTKTFRPRNVRSLPRYMSTSARRHQAFNPDNIPTTTSSTYTPVSTTDVGKEQTQTTYLNRDFGYNTPSTGPERTITRKVISTDPSYAEKHKRRLRKDRTQSQFKEENAFSMPETIDFEDGSTGETYQPRESTITMREKLAFQKIFTDIMARTQKGSPSGTTRSQTTETNERKSAKANAMLNDLLSSAIKQQVPRGKKDLEEAIESYPPVLRDDAARALKAAAERDEEAASNEAATNELDAAELEAKAAEKKALREKAEELEALRADERVRVETLMREAKTDFELWEIMEREVFSMISKLGLEELNSTDPEPLKTRKKGWKKPQPKPESTTENEPLEEETETRILPLQIHGPLYPSYLLLGLRLLDRSFAKPSPLALSILPKIKSLGFISHVLGASTQFYNDLLRIYRYRYDDFAGMITLMKEMEQSALDMDDETIAIVLDVIKMQQSVGKFEKGDAVKALWKMPEFGPGKFGWWREKIVRDIAERRQNSSGAEYV